MEHTKNTQQAIILYHRINHIIAILIFFNLKIFIFLEAFQRLSFTEESEMKIENCIWK